MFNCHLVFYSEFVVILINNWKEGIHMIVPKLEEEEPSIVLLETTPLYCLRGKILLGLLCRGGGSI